MRVLIFILLLPFNTIAQDALLEAMFKDWSKEDPQDVQIDDYDVEPEIYHWELGTPDNIPEIEIIYDQESPCGL